MNKQCLLTQNIICREYARTHGLTYKNGFTFVNPTDFPFLSISKFPEDDLKLSLDDFSTKQGWIK